MCAGARSKSCFDPVISSTRTRSVEIGLQLCRAVSAVHAAGLLHRDIKAQNVMRADDGRVVLMDFGTGGESSAVSPRAAGTPLYLAPESSPDSRPPRGATSTASACCSIDLLTGAYPVHADRSTTVTFGAHIRECPAQPDGPPGPVCPPSVSRSSTVRSIAGRAPLSGAEALAPTSQLAGRVSPASTLTLRAGRRASHIAGADAFGTMRSSTVARHRAALRLNTSATAP